MHDEVKPPEDTGARMGNRVTVGKWKGHKFYKWRASYIEAGKRKKKGFKTKEAAEDWAEKREEESLLHGTIDSLTATERSAVIETREILGELGLSLRAALDHSIDYYRRSQKSASVDTLIAEVIESRRKADLSERYLEDLELRLGRFKTDFGERSVATISRDEIADWLHGLKLAPVSTNNFRRLLVVAFNDAIESGYATENPAEKVKQIKEIESEVGILSPSETLDLLNAADERILPAIAIGAFAGLRSSELKRIDWADVDLAEGHIRVRALAAKSSRNRLIPISDCLNAWLTTCVQEDGKIWPTNGRKILEASKREAGFGNPESLTDEEKEKGKKLRLWPSNALRHSFASYHLAHHKNADDLALQLGHSDTSLIFKHYRELVTAKEAENYWAIMPKKAENVIALNKSA